LPIPAIAQNAFGGRKDGRETGDLVARAVLTRHRRTLEDGWRRTCALLRETIELLAESEK
jgi:hypothetical protein